MPPTPFGSNVRLLVRLTALFTLLLGTGGLPGTALALRVINYNILNFPGSTASVREPAFRTILSSLQPDVIVSQENISQAGVDQFVNNILNAIEPGQWRAVTLHIGPDTQNALYYKMAKITVVDSTYLTTVLRDIAVYRCRLAGYGSSAAEVSLFSMHLKASMGSEAQRATEAQVARNYANALTPGTNFVYCGDLNVYTSTEPGYQVLVGSQADNDGRGKDPINRPGAWNNGGSFADIHTQSTRTGTLTPSDGGATGGLDDRFDQLLISYSLDDGQGLDWVPGSYLAYGNDGHHFNLDINSPPANTAVPQAVADALQRASDHLPVLIVLQAPALAALTPGPIDFGEALVGAIVSRNVEVTNVASLPADELDYSLSAPAGFATAPGPFQAAAGAGPEAHSVSLDTSAPGQASGNLLLTSDDPEQPVRIAGLLGHVLGHAKPSFEAESVVADRTLDWGTALPGQFSDKRFAVYNSGFGPDQAILQLGAPDVQGSDGRFTLSAPSGDPLQVDGDSLEFTVAFHDSGATSDSAYEATISVATGDKPDLPGATAQATLIVHLSAAVGSGPVAVGGPALPSRTALYRPWPNPASSNLLLRFDLARESLVRLELFDAQGRRVGTAAHGLYPAGRHDVSWRARGSVHQAGVYFLRFEGDGLTAVERMVLLP